MSELCLSVTCEGKRTPHSSEITYFQLAVQGDRGYFSILIFYILGKASDGSSVSHTPHFHCKERQDMVIGQSHMSQEDVEGVKGKDGKNEGTPKTHNQRCPSSRFEDKLEVLTPTE